MLGGRSNIQRLLNWQIYFESSINQPAALLFSVCRHHNTLSLLLHLSLFSHQFTLIVYSTSFLFFFFTRRTFLKSFHLSQDVPSHHIDKRFLYIFFFISDLVSASPNIFHLISLLPIIHEIHKILLFPKESHFCCLQFLLFFFLSCL